MVASSQQEADQRDHRIISTPLTADTLRQVFGAHTIARTEQTPWSMTTCGDCFLAI
jgi:hypothetical protein